MLTRRLSKSTRTVHMAIDFLLSLLSSRRSGETLRTFEVSSCILSDPLPFVIIVQFIRYMKWFVGSSAVRPYVLPEDCLSSSMMLDLINVSFPMVSAARRQ